MHPRNFVFFLSFICLSGFIQSAFAQSIKISDWDSSEIYSPIRNGEIIKVNPPTHPPSGLSKSDKKLMAPPTELKNAYKEFLKQPNSGLLRLFVYGAYNRKIYFSGEGAFYSFARKTYQGASDADIGLGKGIFQNDANIGLMVNLGDVNIEEVTLVTNGVSFLANLVAPKDVNEQFELRSKSFKGFKEGSYFYCNQLPVVFGKTYIVRSIKNRESDVLTAFRVVKQDNDGSVILLWKELKKFARPNIRP